MFGALSADVVTRRAITPGERFALASGIEAELFIVPGKLPLYLEGDDPDIKSETGANVGVELCDGRYAHRLCAGRGSGNAGAA